MPPLWRFCSGRARIHSSSSATFEAAAAAIIAAGRRLDARGLAPATAGNYSVRLSPQEIAITVSGRHKGRLTPEDIMRVDPRGSALDGRKPSAETALHVMIYRLYPHINAVLHVHSIAAVALTRHRPKAAGIVFEGYEMLKALPGIATHEVAVDIPVFENTQDIEALAGEVSERLGRTRAPPAYLIRGHGVHGWGKDLDEAERVIEALDHLLSCEIEALRLGAGVRA